MNLQTQSKNRDTWHDEAGNSIPYSHIKPVEKAYEKSTYNIAKKALKVSDHLKELKEYVQQSVAEAVAIFHAEYKGTKKEFKGNYTIRNFNDTIRVEVSVSNPIQFDDLTINEAKEQLDAFLKDGISSKNSALKEMVLDAFKTSSGKMDVKKILALKRYADRINDERYTKAMSLIDAAIRRPASATYYRVAVKNEQGQYKYIPLALADV